MNKFGAKSDELAGYWRRLRSEELHNLYHSPNLIMVIKLVYHTERMGEMNVRIKFWSENLKGRDHFEDHGVDKRIIFESISEK